MVTEFRTSSRNKHVPSEWREKRCDCCGKFFLARGREWSSPLYCSARCVGEARNERRRAARLEPRISKCLVCGASFQHQRSSRRYCSVRCRVAAHHKKMNRPAAIV